MHVEFIPRITDMLNMLAIYSGMSCIKAASEKQQASKESVGTKAKKCKNKILFFLQQLQLH